MDWPSVLQGLQEAVEYAQRSIGRVESRHLESFTPELPADITHARLIRVVTWRVRALAEQLKPHGAINFSQLRPFSYTPAVCGLCGNKLHPSQRFVCMPCAIAQNLALGTISVSAWLRFLLSNYGATGADGRAWIGLLSAAREDEHRHRS
jgi:hypothetical protein